MAEGTGIAWTETEAILTAEQIAKLAPLFRMAKRPLPPPGKVRVPGATFNPWIGCTAVSEGCKNCYAEEGDQPPQLGDLCAHRSRRRATPRRRGNQR